MIEWVFRRLTVNPAALFTEAELRAHSAGDFADLAGMGLLKREPLQYRRATILHQGRALSIVSGADSAALEALDDDDPEFEPVRVSVEDAARWRFDLASWASEFARRHELVGGVATTQARIWSLGALGGSVQVAFVLPRDEQEALLLARSIGPTRQRVILLPSHMRGVQLDVEGPIVWLTPDGFGITPAIETVLRPGTEEMLEPVPGFRHSPDFRSVRAGGVIYPLTPQQAQVVEMLLSAYVNGTPDLGQDYILDRIGSRARELRFTFQGSAAWNSIVVAGGTRGSIRLAPQHANYSG